MNSATDPNEVPRRRRRGLIVLTGALALAAAWLRIPYSGSDIPPRLGRRG